MDRDNHSNACQEQNQEGHDRDLSRDFKVSPVVNNKNHSLVSVLCDIPETDVNIPATTISNENCTLANTKHTVDEIRKNIASTGKSSQNAINTSLSTPLKQLEQDVELEWQKEVEREKAREAAWQLEKQWYLEKEDIHSKETEAEKRRLQKWQQAQGHWVIFIDDIEEQHQREKEQAKWREERWVEERSRVEDRSHLQQYHLQQEQAFYAHYGQTQQMMLNDWQQHMNDAMQRLKLHSEIDDKSLQTQQELLKTMCTVIQKNSINLQQTHGSHKQLDLMIKDLTDKVRILDKAYAEQQENSRNVEMQWIKDKEIQHELECSNSAERAESLQYEIELWKEKEKILLQTKTIEALKQELELTKASGTYLHFILYDNDVLGCTFILLQQSDDCSICIVHMTCLIMIDSRRTTFELICCCCLCVLVRLH